MARAKTHSEIEAMREGGKILATIFRDLREHVHVGVTERELDAWTEKAIKAHGAEATYKTPEVKFPGVVCISTNDQVVHSVPSDYSLRRGDVVSFDMVITYKGMKTDSAFTMVVDEKPHGDIQRLLDYTERSLYAGIDAVQGATRVGNISAAVEKVLVEGRLGIVRELVGHGIGRSMHEAPDIPNYGQAGDGPLLKPGDTIAIEPMAMLGSEQIYQDDRDGWTIATRDGSIAAHFEHTILITEDGAEILTTL